MADGQSLSRIDWDKDKCGGTEESRCYYLSINTTEIGLSKDFYQCFKDT